MKDQKNLFLAIGLSIAIILIFQFFYPQPTMMPAPDKQQSIENSQSAPTTNNEQVSQDTLTIKSKDEIVDLNKRVKINSTSLRGSINLKGAILDDLILSNYKESLEKNSKNINLFYPNQTSNPYYLEIGWKTPKNSSNIDLPNQNTEWDTTGLELSQSTPVTLNWTNKNNITFKIHYQIDDEYMLQINQEIENNSNKTIEVFPYRLLKRINRPDTINFFILHEGLIGLSNEELIEEDYDDLLDDCKENSNDRQDYCDIQTKGGWLGFTDKYWMSALIPDPNELIKVEYRGSNSSREEFIVRYNGLVFSINPNTNHVYQGKVFAGAKVLKILNKYQEEFNITRFNDAIDWGMFSFLTKPIFYSINWFYGIVGNFGVAIIAFTFLMRLILFPLAHASFKSMAKMKKLQPEMQRLKETYPDDRQKMQQELMALYKKEGANPIAGCLPIFLQIPIFFSLYKVLFVTIEMYHAPFYGWIHDLSAPDPLGILTVFGLIPWNVPELLLLVNIGILPILMGVTMWLQQKLNPAPADPTQARIFAILPFVFTFILAGFAAGLVLYWTVNNILSIAQQWVIQRKILSQ
tara:strand:- start:2539 stop:4272 length:1734 start_codon:yes stop_codon:yes gene_type:complete